MSTFYRPPGAFRLKHYNCELQHERKKKYLSNGLSICSLQIWIPQVDCRQLFTEVMRIGVFLVNALRKLRASHGGTTLKLPIKHLRELFRHLALLPCLEHGGFCLLQ